MREERPGGRPGGDVASEAGIGDPPMAPEALAPMLAEVPLFKSLSRRERLRIARAAMVRRVSAGQHICREGFNAEGLFILLTGTATVESSHGTHATLRGGDFFGELGLIDGRPRTANVIAETDLWTVRLPRDRFAALLDREPAIARGIMTVLATRIRLLEETAHARDASGR